MKIAIQKIRKIGLYFKIDVSFICLLVLAIFLDMIKFYLIYVLFIVLHEFFHFCIAWKLGYLPNCVHLSIFGASLEGYDDFLVRDEIKIILAGPLFNLLMVVGCYLSFWFYPESYEFLEDVLIVNQSILLFNILPIFPLDFGRLILCLFSLKNSRKVAVSKTKNVSYFFLVLLFILSVVIFFVKLNLTLGFACINLCILTFDATSGTSFKREIVIRKKLTRLGRGIEQKIIIVNSEFDEKLLLKFLDSEHYFVFIFVDDCFEEVKRIDEFQLLKTLGFIQ